MTGTATLLARAKLNLALHVVGRRDDGYHELESLVVFAEVCDRIEVRDADVDGLAVTGPFASGVPTDGGNIVLKAVERMRAAGAPVPPLAIRLEKNLPHGAGIGGGSADAAAILGHLAGRDGSLRGLARDVAGRLGADVPMCLDGRPAIVSGIGERGSILEEMPALHLVLVNPGVPVATPPIFAALREKRNPPLPPLAAAGFPDLDALLAFLGATRNDLASPAEAIAPAIREASAALRSTGPRFVRMSGSGATVFGLYADGAEAGKAAEELAGRRPDWWVRPTSTIEVRSEGAVAA